MPVGVPLVSGKEPERWLRLKTVLEVYNRRKIVVVKSYTKEDGTRVKEHRRSTPN